MPAMSLTSRGDCVIQDSGGYEPKRFKNYYQKSFIVTCKKGRHTIECKTNSNAMHQNAAVQLEGVLYSTQHTLHALCNHVMYSYYIVSERPPKIINQPRNITTNVGLPVTLTCYVEGDPNHYWVGWMSRHTIIQGGEEHSISTSPNFKSTNGTIHHLTIHSVKETGKYECKVYTIAGDVQDQVTHHISVTDHDGKEHCTLYVIIAVQSLNCNFY